MEYTKKIKKPKKITFVYDGNPYAYNTLEAFPYHLKIYSFAILDRVSVGDMYRDTFLFYLKNFWSKYFIIDEETPFPILWGNMSTLARYKDSLERRVSVCKTDIIIEAIKEYIKYRKIVAPNIISSETTKEKNIVSPE